MSGNHWIFIGAVFACIAVILGAFGAHGLQSHLEKTVADETEQSDLLETWETAARYHMYHALALIFLGLVLLQQPSRALNASGFLFIVGVLVFSGLLYILVLTQINILGQFVPIGGGFMIIGWIVFAVASLGLRSAK